jgi:hypothetical protein
MQNRMSGMHIYDNIIAAIRGQSVPKEPNSLLARLCVIRGIRSHDGFAEELRGYLPEFTRALNARAIMSNRIPDMEAAEDFPYCFWYPDIPTEQTLRALLARYHGNDLLRYQIGRACAAGGFTALFHELDLLPDVAIAEEARDNLASGRAIFDSIVNIPIRYACMDDYNRCLKSPPSSGVHLRGDTCVRSMLDQTLPIATWSLTPPLFDITEDWCIDAEGTVPETRPVNSETVRLLSEPLPADLPVVDKDLLILMAAWEGNIDRYVRLRRPSMIKGEISCVIRGIHQHPFFGKWWSKQPAAPIPIRMAGHARFIMNNDLSWLTDSTPNEELPIVIWFPQTASKETYTELARRRPLMVPQIARACIHANYEELFDSLDPIPDAGLWTDAEKSNNTHYLQRLDRKAVELGIDRDTVYVRYTEEEEPQPDHTWPEIQDVTDTSHMSVLAQEIERNGTQDLLLLRELTPMHVGYESRDDMPSSIVGRVLLNACVADQSVRPSVPFDTLDLEQVYRDKPFVESEEDRKLVGLHPNPRRPRGAYRGRGRR